MPFVRFQDLGVYKLAEELADAVWPIVLGWDGLARDAVGKQLIRAADSIGANIAEGSGRHSPNDNRRFVRIARGSFLETQHWLRRAFTRKLISPEQTGLLRDIIDRLSPMLNSYLRSIGKKATPHDAPTSTD
ncbi:s23 ribosomal protein : S23 ribosomal protein OS=Calothrix sp. PCC 7507 GN=Cal7507_1229 PE=4 SV=1: 23S_rRNA_IVP [Gemmataceae bacterium]|nr:s23 ribosomal protein : S23 ribosomal protein OS=Calothrix sp. PCC 7507 GN=Cal7507_1229 PE=4 SV=1: 23S_rRNA_IVP [Gemmataceae bacterium]VTU02073.1 s23 ribosomal protein : S23 ribosomal protein OS=Calothrix sp. PCC 7507 GN=Cal7507_1229 PE=4 SV=1: 23S_rRNA_IVP [Gemmataceae bacterium]